MADESTKTKGVKKWWYRIAMMGMLCIFFVGMDVFSNGRITWSVWPIGAILFFGIGFLLLNRFGRE